MVSANYASSKWPKSNNKMLSPELQYRVTEGARIVLAEKWHKSFLSTDEMWSCLTAMLHWAFPNLPDFV